MVFLPAVLKLCIEQKNKAKVVSKGGRKMKKSEKKKSSEKAKGATNEQNPMYSETDPNGSYTGVPKDKNAEPIQDVDDL